MNIVSLSASRNILREGSHDRERMREYAERLDSYSVIILTRRAHGFFDVVHDGALTLYPTNSRTRPGMLVDAFCIACRILKNAPQTTIVSAQDPLEIGYVAFLIARLRKVSIHIQVHGDYFSTDAWVGKSWIRKIRRALSLRLLRRVNSIRVVSHRIATSLVHRGIPRSVITVLPIRPQLEAFLTHRTERLPRGPIVFLSLGRLAPEKNIPRMIYAFARVLKSHPDARLEIVGSGVEKERLLHLIRELSLKSAVILSDWTDNTPLIMSRAHVFLLASYHEAYALTLIEAAASGLAIITTDVGCVSEVVQDGVHGTVVRETSVDAYADAMCHMCEDSEYRLQCGRNGRILGETLAKVTEDTYVTEWIRAHSTATTPL